MQKAVEVIRDGMILRGMLHQPKIEGKVPMVLIFHGFTGNKMEPHFMFVKLSRMLEKQGIASLRFDFIGSGESDGYFEEMTLSGEVKDAEAIFEYAQTLDFVDQNKISVIGLSMGGAVASIFAKKYEKDIDRLCLWAPAANMKEHVLSTAEKEMGNINQLHKVKYYDRNGYVIGKAFIEDILNLNIYEKASGFSKDVLLIHGEKDQTVPIEASKQYIQGYTGNCELHIIKNADHTFNKKEWEEEVLKATVEFLT